MKRLIGIALCLWASVCLGDCQGLGGEDSAWGSGDTKNSIDPNEMSGPLGSGEKRYVPQGEWMDYTIYFENQTNATAAAQEIFVDLPMDENLDWATLELGEIAFGDHIITSFVGKKLGLKARLRSSYAIPGTNTFVKTTVTMKDGVLSWYLRDWDPTTVDNFPASATGGFLLPNDPETHCGEGHISYRVKVRSDAPKGAIIRAAAQITFDHNPMIETDPSWWNTVSEDKPMANFAASEVEAAEGEALTFAVTGGNVDAASSVDVYLTYNTATAADVDLGKMKFPLTLSWAKGEVGEKVVTIPVNVDKAVEGDEFFTLQLANAQGVELGEKTVCTVTIKDKTTNLTLQEGMLSPTMTATTKGNGSWFVASGSPLDEEGLPPLYHVESPALAQGKSSTLALSAVKGMGVVHFRIRFSGDPEEATPSRLDVYEGKTLLGSISHADVTNVWVGYTITINSMSGSRAYSFVFTQGSDPNTHAEVSDVIWDSFGNITTTTFYRVYAAPENPAGGIVSGSGHYYYGQVFKLVAKPFPGWTFDGWYEPVEDEETGEVSYFLWSKSAKESYKINRDANVLAFFSKIPYVRGLADPADGGKVTGSGLCDTGKKVTLKATANKNFTFLGWRQAYPSGLAATSPASGEELFVATTATLVIDRTTKPAANSKTSTTITEIDGDVTYYAVFKSDPKVTVAVVDGEGTVAEPTGKGAGKYVAGTITGEGKYATGKKVTLKAAANKGYVFAGWEWSYPSGLAATSPVSGEELKNASLAFAMPSNDVECVAKFVTTDEDKASITLKVDGEALWRDEVIAPYRTNVWCGVYLEWPVAAKALSQTTVKVVGLPSGLKFTAKDILKKGSKTEVDIPANTIYGAPTAASKMDKNGNPTPSTVKVTVTTAGKSSATYEIALTVDPLPAWAAGTFDGAVRSYPSGLAATSPVSGEEPCGTVSLAVDAKGKISGKMLRDDGTWTLSAGEFSHVERVERVEDGVVFHAAVIGKNGKLLETNEVTVAAAENGAGVATGGPQSSAAAAGTEAGPPVWTAYQNLWKRADTKGDMPVIKKDIKVDHELGEPGDANNKLTLTFKKDGAVAFAGKIDGASVSGSSQLVLVGRDDLLAPSYQVTIYAPPKPTAKPPFAGFRKTLAVTLTLDEKTNVVTNIAIGEDANP